MRLLKSLAIVIAAWTSLTDSAAGQSSCEVSEATREVCAMEEKLTEALRLNNAAGLLEIYAQEFRLVNYRGKKVDRDGVLSAIRAGALRFDSLSTSDLDVRVYGEVGVVSGIQHQVAREPGGDGKAHPAKVRFTHVYVRRDARWWLAQSQITPIL